jgi:hypothetical protein
MSEIIFQVETVVTEKDGTKRVCYWRFPDYETAKAFYDTHTTEWERDHERYLVAFRRDSIVRQ